MVSSSLHSRLHRGAVWHAHAVRIDVLSTKCIRILHAVQELSNALSMADWTIFVAKKKGAKTPNLIMKLCHLGGETVVFGRVHFHLGLEVSQPLLLSLSTFQSGHPECCK